ncbi:UbiX family flavin prenyltransferase [Pararhodospirillum photometricum]|uniref:Flavin prenyltransferase UbiX n=1 Tax=Pararhodospirillum photometricum DSM 122 TaxID=1150469 RepID=H6SKM3_PARPM|nr:UbiX family flavin prenyltransferase [Pararhodospirillum photometricum]CCG08538.1 Phenylacrylic acid decarboxylase [Pararhodospirillum photometricum DSM 122]
MFPQVAGGGVTRRVIVALSGASGAIYGVRLLLALSRVPDVERHLILSQAALRTLAAETDVSPVALRALADVVHDHRDIGASLASGSFKTLGMIVAPCSIKTLSGIVNCYSDNLTVRAADVCLKERRRLVLLVRETPLHLGHLDLMTRATAAGAIVMPPVPAFYQRPTTLLEMVDQTVGRALDLLDIDSGLVQRWTGTSPCPPAPRE